jgi:hypothetical protein
LKFNHRNIMKTLFIALSLSLALIPAALSEPLKRGETGTDAINKAIDSLLVVASAAPVNGVAASRVLTVDTQPTAGDTFTIGSKVYTFVAAGTADADGEINLGADLTATKPLIVTAINGGGFNTAHPDFTAAAFSGNNMTITAIVKGTIGNGKATTETFTAGTNVWAGATTTGGVDGTPGQAKELRYYNGFMYFTPTTATSATATWVKSAAWGAL